MVGEGNIEIWLIRSAPTATVPRSRHQDRRKQMEGNALFNQLRAIYMLNDIHAWGGYTQVAETLQWRNQSASPNFLSTQDRPTTFAHGVIT
jgi:hypothetical protein